MDGEQAPAVADEAHGGPIRGERDADEKRASPSRVRHPAGLNYESAFPFEGVLHAVDIHLVRVSRDQERDVAGAEGRSAIGRQ